MYSICKTFSNLILPTYISVFELDTCNYYYKKNKHFLSIISVVLSLFSLLHKEVKQSKLTSLLLQSRGHILKGEPKSVLFSYNQCILQAMVGNTNSNILHSSDFPPNHIRFKLHAIVYDCLGQLKTVLPFQSDGIGNSNQQGQPTTAGPEKRKLPSSIQYYKYQI